jgi:hypothetical protein
MGIKSNLGNAIVLECRPADFDQVFESVISELLSERYG